MSQQDRALIDDSMRDAQLSRAIEAAVGDVGAEEGSLFLDAGNGGLVIVACRSPVAAQLIGSRQPEARGITGFVFQFQQPMVVANVAEAPEFDGSIDAAVGSSTRAIIAVPVSSPQKTYGVVTAINPKSEDGFGEPELERMLKLSAQIVSLLEAGPTP